MNLAARQTAFISFSVFLSLLCTTVSYSESPAANTNRVEFRTLLAGEPAETLVYIRKSPHPGPTVMIVGGMHGNEPAGAAAAEQIRQWPIDRGRLIVLPRANQRALQAAKRYTPSLPDSTKNLNRNFVPSSSAARNPREVTAKGQVAPKIWSVVQKHEPDWLIDLHEGFHFHRINDASVGSSVIATKDDAAQQAANAMLKRLNPTIPDEKDFMLLGPPIATSLARTFHVAYGRPAMILETTFREQRLPLRVRQHRNMVHTLLTRLGMVHGQHAVDFYRDPNSKNKLVMIFDDGGVGASIEQVEKAARNAPEHDVIRVDAVDIRAGILDTADLIVFPGGSGSAQSKSLGEQGRQQVRHYIEQGGDYVGICAGAYLACDGFSWGLKVLDAKTVSNRWRRGVGKVDVQWMPKATQVWEDLPKGTAQDMPQRSVHYANGPIFEPNQNESLPDYEVLAWFRTELAKNNTPVGVMINSPAIVSARFGKGRVLCLSPHFEKTPGAEHRVTTAVRKLTEQ